MALHHTMQPHHHVASWAVCALLVILMAVLSANSAQTIAQSDHDGPSDSTKQFFGADDDEEGDQYSQPTECQQPSTSATSSSGSSDKINSLNSEVQNLQSQLQTYQSRDPSSLTEDEKAAKAALEAKIKAANAEIETLSSQINQDAQQPQTQETGPSEACRIAIAKMMVSHMKKFAGQFDSKFIPVLNRVDAVVKKIDGSISDLKEAGVSASDIKSIEKDLATIKSAVNTLRDFFNHMKGKVNEFIVKAEADPSKAFTLMETMNDDPGRFKTAGDAADQMVATFTTLEATIDKIVAASTPKSSASPSPSPSPTQ